jgi:hypothetical protein
MINRGFSGVQDPFLCHKVLVLPREKFRKNENKQDNRTVQKGDTMTSACAPPSWEICGRGRDNIPSDAGLAGGLFVVRAGAVLLLLSLTGLFYQGRLDSSTSSSSTTQGVQSSSSPVLQQQ